MGLDMYLEGEKFLWRGAAGEKLSELLPEFGGLPIKKVRAQVAYWRKANQIHSWFVQNVQNGTDDCGDYEVSREQLTTLLNLCKKALNTKDHTLLEPTDGFFFGGTDIDEWYWANLKETVTQLKAVLKLPKDIAIYYHSSW